jgi:hypothetical protein
MCGGSNSDNWLIARDKGLYINLRKEGKAEFRASVGKA